MKIGDIVKHKLTKEKLLIVHEYWQYSLEKCGQIRTGYECRTTNYDLKIFHDIELIAEKITGKG